LKWKRILQNNLCNTANCFEIYYFITKNLFNTINNLILNETLNWETLLFKTVQFLVPILSIKMSPSILLHFLESRNGICPLSFPPFVKIMWDTARPIKCWLHLIFFENVYQFNYQFNFFLNFTLNIEQKYLTEVCLFCQGKLEFSYETPSTTQKVLKLKTNLFSRPKKIQKQISWKKID